MTLQSVKRDIYQRYPLLPGPTINCFNYQEVHGNHDNLAYQEKVLCDLFAR